jgi:hypothetical protein
MAFGAGSAARACGARICFFTLGFTMGAGACAIRGSAFVMAFFGSVLTL